MNIRGLVGCRRDFEGSLIILNTIPDTNHVNHSLNFIFFYPLSDLWVKAHHFLYNGSLMQATIIITFGKLVMERNIEMCEC